MRPLRALLFVLVATALPTGAACGGGLSNPITALNVQGCIKKNCSESEATAYQACEASCRQQYAK